MGASYAKRDADWLACSTAPPAAADCAQARSHRLLDHQRSFVKLIQCCWPAVSCGFRDSQHSCVMLQQPTTALEALALSRTMLSHLRTALAGCLTPRCSTGVDRVSAKAGALGGCGGPCRTAAPGRRCQPAAGYWRMLNNTRVAFRGSARAARSGKFIGRGGAGMSGSQHVWQ